MWKAAYDSSTCESSPRWIAAPADHIGRGYGARPEFTRCCISPLFLPLETSPLPMPSCMDPSLVFEPVRPRLQAPTLREPASRSRFRVRRGRRCANLRHLRANPTHATARRDGAPCIRCFRCRFQRRGDRSRGTIYATYAASCSHFIEIMPDMADGSVTIYFRRSHNAIIP